MRVLVVDNHDSFVYNLVQYLGQLGAEVEVRRNDDITVPAIGGLGVSGVLLSPGPGNPDQAGISLDLVDRYAGELPILGVCLGHQVIAQAYGATVSQAPELLHGRTSEVTHTGTGVLRELADPFTATRYHSLAVVESTLPPDLVVTARTVPPADLIQDFVGLSHGEPTDQVDQRYDAGGGPGQGVVMAVQHRSLPLAGVQFHPESVLTQDGHLLLANWLTDCGLAGARERVPALAAEVEARRRTAFEHP